MAQREASQSKPILFVTDDRLIDQQFLHLKKLIKFCVSINLAIILLLVAELSYMVSSIMKYSHTHIYDGLSYLCISEFTLEAVFLALICLDTTVGLTALRSKLNYKIVYPRT
jgi:hypothetical protein